MTIETKMRNPQLTCLPLGTSVAVFDDGEYRRSFYAFELAIKHGDRKSVIEARVKKLGEETVFSDENPTLNYVFIDENEFDDQCNRVRMTFFHEGKTAKVGPRGNVMVSQDCEKGRGLGGLMLSSVIAHAQQNYSDYQVLPGSLGPADATIDNIDRRTSLYQSRGFVVELWESGGGRFYAKGSGTVGDLTPTMCAGALQVLDPVETAIQLLELKRSLFEAQADLYRNSQSRFSSISPVSLRQSFAEDVWGNPLGRIAFTGAGILMVLAFISGFV